MFLYFGAVIIPQLMNYLAHLLLAGPEAEWRLGGMLGDHVRGGDWRHYSPDVAAGILLHRAIDRATDTHPAVVGARRALPPPFRRFAGIILDVLFDHLLACGWSRYHPLPLPQFAAQNYRLLAQHHAELPASLQRFADHLIERDLLLGYRNTGTIDQVFVGLSQRLTRRNPLGSAGRLLSDGQRMIALQACFDQLLPDLQAFATEYRSTAIARVAQAQLGNN